MASRWASEKRQVLSTARQMLGSGLVVAMEARPETIYARLASAPATESAEGMVRPLLQAEGRDPLDHIETLKRERQWAYALAHWTVPTDALSVEQGAHEVVRAWRRFGGVEAWHGDPMLAAIVTVESGAYPIFVGWDVLEEQLGGRLLETGFSGRAYIVCDSNVLHPYGRAAQFSLHILTNALDTYTANCIVGITANVETCKRYAETSPSLATAMNPIIGYKKAAEVVKVALAQGKSIPDVVREMGLLDKETLKKALDPAKLTEPGIPGSVI